MSILYAGRQQDTDDTVWCTASYTVPETLGSPRLQGSFNPSAPSGRAHLTGPFALSRLFSLASSHLGPPAC